jgi:hypothetical protein
MFINLFKDSFCFIHQMVIEQLLYWLCAPNSCKPQWYRSEDDPVLMGLTFLLGELKHNKWEGLELGSGMSPEPIC